VNQLQFPFMTTPAAQSDDAYQHALDFLYSFINLERQAVDRYHESKINTARPRLLLELLGNPHQQFPAIHIAGTKGKGSVAAMCANCLRLAGLSVGLYTSPHLREFRERIRVLSASDADGRISEASFVQLMDQVRAALPKVPGITWFEIVTAIAFLHFARAAVDVAVVEVGLGGRLDATNVLTPLVSVITTLSLDHTQLLGDTLGQIAAEKGGIIKHGVPVVTASQRPEAMQVLRQIAAERRAPLVVIGQEWLVAGAYSATPLVASDQTATGEGRAAAVHRLPAEPPAASAQQLVVQDSPSPEWIPPGTPFHVALAGEHQLENAVVALAALHEVRERFPGLSLAHLQAGLATVEWDGRLQLLRAAGNGYPGLLVDCAHNEDSARRLATALTTSYSYERLILIFGAPADKNIVAMMHILFPLASKILLTAAHHPRASAPDWLAEQAAALGFVTTVTTSIAQALSFACAEAGDNDLICATGSIIVIGELLNHWDTLQSGG
jgi:dihydrofolate synthase/folylpolyglutamate synthase